MYVPKEALTAASGLTFAATAHGRLWPIATDDALTANRRFRGIADMDRFSSRNDL